MGGLIKKKLFSKEAKRCCSHFNFAQGSDINICDINLTFLMLFVNKLQPLISGTMPSFVAIGLYISSPSLLC
jgi:hypothetical protein